MRMELMSASSKIDLFGIQDGSIIIVNNKPYLVMDGYLINIIGDNSNGTTTYYNFNTNDYMIYDNKLVSVHSVRMNVLNKAVDILNKQYERESPSAVIDKNGNVTNLSLYNTGRSRMCEDILEALGSDKFFKRLFESDSNLKLKEDAKSCPFVVLDDDISVSDYIENNIIENDIMIISHGNVYCKYSGMEAIDKFGEIKDEKISWNSAEEYIKHYTAESLHHVIKCIDNLLETSRHILNNLPINNSFKRYYEGKCEVASIIKDKMIDEFGEEKEE